MIWENDVVVFISHSWNTNEIIKILPIIKNKIHVPTIAITGNASSILKKESELSLCYRIESEWYLNLPPKASTSVQLFIWDLIASALMEKKNFRDANFAVFHPWWNLWKKLLLSLENIIDTQDGNLDEVCCTNNVNLKELILLLSSWRKGAIIVISDSKEVLGIFTDGDLKRILIDSNYADFDSISLHEIMTKNPKTIYIDESPKQALAIMESHNITVLPVLNRWDNTVVWIINIHDLFKNGLK
jgi:arabinose-5-phosphate isomerase